MNIVFDIGGVLLGWHPIEFLNKYFPDYANEYQEIIFSSKEWQSLDLGTHNLEEVKEMIIKKYPQYSVDITFIFSHFMQEVLTPMYKTYEAVKALKKAGYPIYILSNIHRDIYEPKASEYKDVFDLFDGKVLSGDEHLIKPDERLFEVLFKRYSLDPSECIFIDDSPANIEAAIHIGMKGIVMKQDTELNNELKAMGVILP